MQELYLDLTCFTDPDLVFTLPPWDTLPYEFVSPPENIERERITAIYRMIRGLPSLIVTAVESLVRKVPEKNYFTGNATSVESVSELIKVQQKVRDEVAPLERHLLFSSQVYAQQAKSFTESEESSSGLKEIEANILNNKDEAFMGQANQDGAYVAKLLSVN